jgi:hypothetical protein
LNAVLLFVGGAGIRFFPAKNDKFSDKSDFGFSVSPVYSAICDVKASDCLRRLSDRTPSASLNKFKADKESKLVSLDNSSA